ncbi:acyl-CoA synthetase [Streptomyces lucensis JCM 4490]|uniref:Acyl-CoA synthetase n=1 Tax=Streptomyces lucensis JCM 4490 TaxID=1306176 RepID=A0A918J1F6_9ACTN|nr:fatty acyl-AMP ligase [Streptomyces lucensis]GGW42121.1 acyl-CoA synthetase [Streptomyces lucensis JCM 4490]
MSTTGPHTSADVRTLPDALRLRSEKQPDETAYVFLLNGEEPHESLTYRELHADAGARAAAFGAAGLSGRSAVLLYPSGLEFVRTLLGCMYGGVASAPVQVPRRREEVLRLRRIADDAGTTTVLTTTEVVRDLRERFGDMPALAGLTLLATDAFAYPAGAAVPAPPGPADTALLQYTSGSTGDPKGVVVSHANFLANVVETDELWPCEPNGTVVSWLPLFHDMGMLFGVVLPLWAGIPSYLMAPDAFIRRPARWLEAIARFRGTHAAAPSFAYELCARAAAEGRTGAVGDLSSWRVAANGAEPVRWATIRSFTEAFAPYGFDARAMCPGYGLAENTLKATGSRQDERPSVLWLSAEALRDGRAQLVDEHTDGAVPLVGSGRTVGGTRVRIVAPDTREVLPEGRVGEIWINGPCVAGGYLGRPVVTEETFRARTAGADDDGETYLRTGDLGLLYDGELYVNGRLKDVIIRKGRNHYPQDIELSAERAVAGLHPNCAAAFSCDDGERERLVVVVETDGRLLNSLGAEAIRDRVYHAVGDRQRIRPDEVLVVRRGALPKTSSGKVQRRECKRRYEQGELVALTPAVAAAAGEA